MQSSRSDPRSRLRGTRAQPHIDKRYAPPESWSIGKWFRRSPLAVGLAAYFDMSNVAPDQTLAQLSPAALNDLAAPDWPEFAAEPVMKRGALVGVDLHPVEIPVIGPMPIFIPDLYPEFDPTVPLPVPRPQIEVANPFAPLPPQAPARPKSQAEITIVIQQVGGTKSDPVIRVRAVQRFKYQIYQNQVRRVDAKGVYLRIQQLFTATFGTLTEIQDFVEAAAWNVLDSKGRPVMMMINGQMLDKTEGIDHAFTRGIVVNFRSYSEAFAGLIDGRYTLDLGGFAFDYTMAQWADREIAFQGKALERFSRRLGLDSVMGVEAMMGMHRRIHGMPRQERMSYVREIQKQWRSTFAGRLYWSRSGLRSAR